MVLNFCFLFRVWFLVRVSVNVLVRREGLAVVGVGGGGCRFLILYFFWILFVVFILGRGLVDVLRILFMFYDEEYVRVCDFFEDILVLS